MSFENFLNQAWSDHADDATGVADRLPEGASLITKPDQIAALARLVTHVYGEHLGQWSSGIGFLEGMKQLKLLSAGCESERAVNRSICTLDLGQGKRDRLAVLSLSDQIQVLGAAAAALAAQQEVEKAQICFHEALEKAASGLAKEDPANRALAIAGNNLARSLEEKERRSPADTKLMITAAQTGRKFWEIAGTWLEVERAEYRLAMSFWRAGDHAQAAKHAQACLEVSKEHNAPLELFFAYEALALIEHARKDATAQKQAVIQAQASFEQLSADDKSWCEATLKKLLAL